MARQAPAPAKTRKDQKEDTKERIKAAALGLFSTVGYDATTTKAVADRAGVASGTVFVHARDKPDLLALVMFDLLRAASDRGFAAVDPREPLLSQLLTLFRPIFAMYGENQKLAGPFIRTLPGSDGPNGLAVNQLTFEFLGRIAALVTDAQAKGEVAEDVPPLLLAQNVFSLYFAALLSWVSGMTTLETALDPHLRMALDLQLRGVLRR